MKYIMVSRWDGFIWAIYGGLKSECPYPVAGPTEAEWRIGYNEGAKVVLDHMELTFDD